MASARTNTDPPDGAGSLASYFSNAFTWLDPVLCYSPLWIAKQRNQPIANNEASPTTQTTTNYIGLSLNITLVLLYFALQSFYQITQWHKYPAINNVIWSSYIVCISASRLLSIVYCHKYFNWPWKPESSSVESQHEDLSNKKLVVRCKKLSIYMAISYIVLDITVIILQTEPLLAYYHDSLLAYILIKCLCRTILDYPQMVVAIIQSTVFLKYCLRLHQLYDDNMHSMRLSTVDVQHLFERYNALYESFKRDYHTTLRFSLLLYLAAQILIFWDSLNFIGMFVLFVIIVKEFPIFVLYFYTASILQSIHQKFAHGLWENGFLFLNNEAKNQSEGYYNYILHYIQRYPIFVKIGPVVISGGNAMKFIVGLFASRGIAYAFRHWVEENY